MNLKYDRAVKAGQGHGWLFAMACTRVEGEDTARLADKLKISPDTVERYRHAGNLYKRIRPITARCGNLPLAVYLRMNLSISHFRTASYAGKRYNKDLEELIDMLVFAVDENLTVDRFRAFIQEQWGPEEQFSFLRYARRGVKNLGKAVKQPDCPKSVRIAFGNAIEVLEKWESANK